MHICFTVWLRRILSPWSCIRSFVTVFLIPGRKKTGHSTVLLLQRMCDGYSGYNKVPDAKRTACWAYIRRYLTDAIPKGSKRLNFRLIHFPTLYIDIPHAKTNLPKFTISREIHIPHTPCIIHAGIHITTNNIAYTALSHN